MYEKLLLSNLNSSLNMLKMGVAVAYLNNDETIAKLVHNYRNATRWQNCETFETSP